MPALPSPAKREGTFMTAESHDVLSGEDHKAPRPTNATARSSPLAAFLKAAELDTRMLGMAGALLLIWIAFDVLSGGLFLTPRNLWNLSVQSSPVAIMAAGMVLVIVTRNIDLSVGSMLGFVGMIMGVVQTDLLPKLLGFEHPAIWIVALAAGLLLGIALGAFQGFVIAYLGIPSFIVTLGGLLVWRGAAWWVTSGQTVAPLDLTFRLMGGGPEGSIGAAWSWAVGAIACVAVVLLLAHGRARRKAFDFALRPMAAEVFLGGVACALILAAVAIVNAYPWPAGVVRRYAEANRIALPGGSLFIAHGIAIPVLIAIGVGVAVTFLATRTRFGRYVYAIGGNPEAAALAGVNTRRVIMKTFMLMGLLAAIAGAISIARLNAATNSEGTLSELLVIAAAVIGGTSLAGGTGTVAGAMLGAVLMQSLQSGMVLLGVDTPLQSIVVGAVLVVAVGLDMIYRRRVG
jgi:D-xylose transport system permease protein